LHFVPNDAQAWMNRGTLRLDQADYRRAVADYEQAMSLDSGQAANLRPWLDKIGRLSRLQREGPAREYAAACCERGWAHTGGTAYRHPTIWFSRAVEAQPDHAEAWYGRGAAHGNLAHYQEAIQDCSRAIELDPKYAEAWRTRGWARRLAGDNKGSV